MELLQFPVALIDTVAISTGPTFVEMITAQVINYFIHLKSYFERKKTKDILKNRTV